MSRSALPRLRRLAATAVLLALTSSLAACGGDDETPAAGGGAESSDGATAPEVNLGYFDNVTHAAALIGVSNGYFTDELGDTTLNTQTFNSGTEAVEAIFGGALDMTYVGPNPAINAYAESDGAAIRIIAGATSGGAQLVVREGIDSPQDLVGTTLATPSLGNTQDVALRAWLGTQNLESSIEGGGDVTITPTSNSDTLAAFQAGDIDGAWLPEPWASRLVLEAGAKVLVDEADLWPDGQFVTTQLIVRTEFLEQYPGTVEAVLRAHVKAVQFANDNSDEAKDVVNKAIGDATGEPLSDAVIDRAWDSLTITNDPIASSLAKSAQDALDVGTSDTEVDLNGIYDLSMLNAILTEEGLDPVSAGGLGKE